MTNQEDGMMDQGAGTPEFRETRVRCESCQGGTFRRSRLQLKDVGGLLSLQYPVRCLSCSKRQTVALAVARRAVPSSVQQVRAPRDGAAWNAGADTIEQVRPAEDAPAVPSRPPVTMPDLHGVRLPHVAYVPPGSGENLTR